MIYFLAPPPPHGILTYRVTHHRYSPSRRLPGLVLVALLFSPLAALFLRPQAARAQETVRMSLASAAAADARKQANLTTGFYNLKLGPTAWRFNTGLATEWSDNIRLQPTDEKSDLSLRPEMTAHMLWPVSEFNAIHLNLGGGYAAYLEHPEYDHLFIRPGSELSFDLYVGDLWINVYDRFSILEDSYRDPTVSGTGGYTRLENAVGASFTWDLNELIARLELTHLDYLGLQETEGAEPDGASDMASASVAAIPCAGLTLGVETGLGLLRYDERTSAGYDQALQWNAGVFTSYQLTDYMHLRANAGYTAYAPDTGDLLFDPGDFSGYYAQLLLDHRLNGFVRYQAGGGRQVNFTFYGGTVDLYFGRLNLDWSFIRDVTLNTGLEFEHGEYVSFGQEQFTRWGPSIRAGRQLMKQLSGTLEYRFYNRNSDDPNRDYTVNILRLCLNYSF